MRTNIVSLYLVNEIFYIAGSSIENAIAIFKERYAATKVKGIKYIGSVIIQALDSPVADGTELLEWQHVDPESIILKPEDTASDLDIEDAEKNLVRMALERSEGKRAEAAKLLGISERTIYRKMKEYNL